jgi:rod shape-determining protein MreD
MIMPLGQQQLLLPAKPTFIWGTLLLALLFNMVQNIGWWGRAAWAPDVLALVLVFWNVHQPRRVGMLAAFVFGMLVDVHQGSVLGQHALSYTVLSYFGITIHRRLLWFSVPQQALQVLPLLLTSHVVSLIVRLWVGDGFPGFMLLIAPLLEAVLWVPVSVLLLLPQKQAPDPDANRPL